jgi:hypothetical protein
MCIVKLYIDLSFKNQVSTGGMQSIPVQCFTEFQRNQGTSRQWPMLQKHTVVKINGNP